MKTWVETSCVRLVIEEETNHKEGRHGVRSYHNTNMDDLREMLSQLEQYCNKNQYEIKGVAPIDRAETNQFANYNTWSNVAGGGGAGWGWGLGYGWGYSKIVGYTVMLQRIDKIDDEEYQTRLSNSEKAGPVKEKIAELKKGIDALKEGLKTKREELEPLKNIKEEKVQQSGGMMGKKYTFHGKKFKHESEANEFRTFCINKYDEICEEIAKYEKVAQSNRDEIKEAEQELANLLYWQPQSFKD
jgi:hypothetical protein